MIKIHKVTRYEFDRKKVYGLMVDRGFNLGDVAKKCGLTQSAVSCWMTGKGEPTMRNLKKLADALGMKPETLLITPGTKE